jgi:hypothetical protein
MSNTSALGGGPTLWTDFGNSSIPTYGSMTPSFVQQHGSEANALWSRILGQSDISWNRCERPSDDSGDNRNFSRISLRDSSEPSRFSSTMSYSISDELTMSCAGEDKRRGRVKSGPSSTRRTRNRGGRQRFTNDGRHSQNRDEAGQEAGHDPERT